MEKDKRPSSDCSSSRFPLLSSESDSFQEYMDLKARSNSFSDGLVIREDLSFRGFNFSSNQAPSDSNSNIPKSSISTVNVDDQLGVDLLDPRRLKRIAANRASALKNRQKKQDHLMELENKLRKFQTEIAEAIPQILLCKEECNRLEMENKILSEKMKLRARIDLIKDAKIEEDKAEVKRLTKLISTLQQYKSQTCMGRRAEVNLDLNQLPDHELSQCGLIPDLNQDVGDQNQFNVMASNNDQEQE